MLTIANNIFTQLRIKGCKLRARYYSLFYCIGKECSFQRITFWNPYGYPLPKQSINIGNKVIIARDTELIAFDDKPIIIGDNSFINQRCLIFPGVTIGQNVSIGPNTTLITATHVMGPSSRRADATVFKPINIGDGCWLATNVVILPGISIGKGSVIAAGSVVINDCDPDSLYGGVPAKCIRKLD
jgi:acetyltransferase-like isoleucine patch superfamily enzyme